MKQVFSGRFILAYNKGLGFIKIRKMGHQKF